MFWKPKLQRRKEKWREEDWYDRPWYRKALPLKIEQLNKKFKTFTRKQCHILKFNFTQRYLSCCNPCDEHCLDSFTKGTSPSWTSFKRILDSKPSGVCQSIDGSQKVFFFSKDQTPFNSVYPYVTIWIIVIYFSYKYVFHTLLVY